MLIKLISSFFLLTFLSGCANIAPQDIPTEIQKTNNVGQLVLTTSTPIFYVFDLKAIDSSPTDGYITFFTNAVAISYYAGRVVTSKVFNFKDIEKVSFSTGEVTEYYRPKFITVSWNSTSQVNQFAFKSGNTYYALRLSDEDFRKVQGFFKSKGLIDFSFPLVKRTRSAYDAQMEQSGDPMTGWSYVPRK